MDELLRQLGQYVLGSVPTMIIFVVLVLAYRYLLYLPLVATLRERRQRTHGAIERAHAAISAADARTQEYEAKLRAARAEIYRAREQRVQRWNAERDSALASARLSAHDRVQQAQHSLHVQAAEAKRQLESTADQLAAQVLQAVLPPMATAGSAR